MARKSRKQPSKTVTDNIRSAVGYIRLSVANKDESCSVENQKLIIEQWAMQHELFISHFYIDANHSGSNFDRPAFKQMLTDISSGQINCIVVKDDCVNIELKSESLETAGFCDVSSSFLTRKQEHPIPQEREGGARRIGKPRHGKSIKHSL